jgi:palmitoyltransferase ZDHHC9/14/18
MSTPSQAAEGAAAISTDAGASQTEAHVARPLSIDSDEFTDYGEPTALAHTTGAATTSPSKSATGPSQSRPSSAHTGRSSHGNWSQATPHRPGIPPSYAGSVGAASNRPPTSHSRTHVPSLTAQAFYRPMSSQKLQAQRGQRPQLPVSGSVRPQTDEAEEDEEIVGEDDQTEVGRPGKQINVPVSQGYPATGPLRPPSQGTDVTEMPVVGDATKVSTVVYDPDRASANASPHADTIRTHASDAPLQNVPLSKHRNKPPRLDLGKLSGTSNGAKSPRSFRSSLIPSRNGRHSIASLQGRQAGREKLPSNASSPHPDKHAKEMVTRSPGKNYEYFSGNTVFCLGGRLQNSRDRPINIISAIFILLPVGLFGGYS